MNKIFSCASFCVLAFLLVSNSNAHEVAKEMTAAANLLLKSLDDVPTFILEYDNTQNQANHVHAVWRDFKNDFGEDLLKKHYESVPHKD